MFIIKLQELLNCRRYLFKFFKIDELLNKSYDELKPRLEIFDAADKINANFATEKELNLEQLHDLLDITEIVSEIISFPYIKEYHSDDFNDNLKKSIKISIDARYNMLLKEFPDQKDIYEEKFNKLIELYEKL